MKIDKIVTPIRPPGWRKQYGLLSAWVYERGRFEFAIDLWTPTWGLGFVACRDEFATTLEMTIGPANLTFLLARE